MGYYDICQTPLFLATNGQFTSYIPTSRYDTMQFSIHIRIQDPDLGQYLTKSCRPPQLSTHWNMSITSSDIPLKFKIPVPGSGLWSGSSSKAYQFVHLPAAIDPLNFIQIYPYLLQISRWNLKFRCKFGSRIRIWLKTKTNRAGPRSYRRITFHRNPSITSSDIPMKCKNPM